MASFFPIHWSLSKTIGHIVDDDDAVRIDAYLTLKGMDVVVFGSAQELLGYENALPNLLIIDVNMPEIDGFMLLETLRNRGHDAPAVLITGLQRSGNACTGRTRWSGGFRQAYRSASSILHPTQLLIDARCEI
jgi:CheY-like chemotaxis protein